MNAQELKHQAKLLEWKEYVVNCRSSGKSVRAWCEENGVGYKTYYRWEREVLKIVGREYAARNTGEQALPTPTFAELPAAGQRTMEQPKPGGGKVTATVRIGEVIVDIYPDADPAIIQSLCQALKPC